jgi:hypothetical protein
MAHKIQIQSFRNTVESVILKFNIFVQWKLHLDWNLKISQNN